MNIAIYDLDKTITRRPTFTHFLLFYARRNSPFRLLALPLWVIALIGYRIGLYGRKPLKQSGIALFMGRNIDAQRVDEIAKLFVSEVVMHDIQPGAAASIEMDRDAGHKLVIASAAPAFYTAEIAGRLGFDAFIATLQIASGDAGISHRIDGENCYGPEKLNMVRKWFDSQGWERSDCHISVYSDHASDAPLLDWADSAYLVNPSEKLRRLAKQKKWHVRDFSSARDY